MRDVAPRGRRSIQLIEVDVAYRKFSARKMADSRRHFCKHRKVESVVLSGGFRKEFLDVKELCQSSEINKVPRLCSAKYRQYLVNREFLAGKD